MKNTPKSTTKEREWKERKKAVSIIPLGVSHLAVSYFGVPVRVRREHPSQGGYPHLALEGRVLGQRAVEVTLDLLRRHTALAHGRLHQMYVVTGMRGKIRHGV